MSSNFDIVIVHIGTFFSLESLNLSQTSYFQFFLNRTFLFSYCLSSSEDQLRI
uniref:Uncharacterized protein n=1 Tax=Rhizophagus irregularis (strain DAOM 181602 / DAOM 197198 / MUCL 43194) TaxID=747089 RepID=U9ST30_RHIID